MSDFLKSGRLCTEACKQVEEGKAVCPADPDAGARVETQFGKAVFNGYCWSEAWLCDSDRSDAEPDDDDPDSQAFELGSCSCGAYWGHRSKCVRCVFCGRFVSLT